jgi:hypothetical protein
MPELATKPKILTKYILLIYVSFLFQFAVTYFVSRYLLKPNDELEEYAKKSIFSLICIVIGIIFYSIFINYSQNVQRLLSIILSITSFISLHFLIEQSSLTESEIKRIATTFVIGLIITLIIGFVLASHFGKSRYGHVIFVLMVTLIMSIMLFTYNRIFVTQNVINYNKIIDYQGIQHMPESNPVDFLYFVAIFIIVIIALNTWMLFTEYGDYNPFFASTNLYTDFIRKINNFSKKLYQNSQ